MSVVSLLCLAVAGCTVVADPVAVRSSLSPVSEPPLAVDDAAVAPDPQAVPEVGLSDDTDDRSATPSRSVTAGDQRFPALGSSDIDVEHYDVTLEYDPDSRSLVGSVALDGTFVYPTDRVALDLNGPEVAQVRSEGNALEFSLVERDLIVALDDVRPAGSEFSLTVEYSVKIAEQSFFGGGLGLFPTRDGLWSLNEPDGASTWLPVSDHPTDKATWTFEVTVPAGLVAISNGELVDSAEGAAGTTWTWDQTEPMASYLVLLLVGDYELVDDGVSSSGVDLDLSKLQVERVMQGTSFDDSFDTGTGKAGDFDAIIFSGDGADVVKTGKGNDFIDAGSGDDKIDAGGGHDVIVGGDGQNDVKAGDGNDTVQPWG